MNACHQCGRRSDDVMTTCDSCSEQLCTGCAGPGSWDLGKGTETVYTLDNGRKPVCRECLWLDRIDAENDIAKLKLERSRLFDKLNELEAEVAVLR